ncbi:Dimeric alpha-beta barrel [Penicillium mononematosum]|uniref:Dimeric alpha-beta barrel n=1 Tax=Penicillium mononematosum TaxID=268346 RepID=UPI002547AC52|nr:Dimeric alpha-beta barrel [Penicillium mononematosum]KAJ6184609.1 Dimeric alpha-beta barrel [Penicillium mononematosum]
MVYRVMVFSPRKTTITHEEFKTRYEQHMRMIADICGDAAPPLAHATYDAVVTMSFGDEAAWGRFCCALNTPEAKAMIETDEAGFWDRERMKVMVVEDVRKLEK